MRLDGTWWVNATNLITYRSLQVCTNHCSHYKEQKAEQALEKNTAKKLALAAIKWKPETKMEILEGISSETCSYN